MRIMWQVFICGLFVLGIASLSYAQNTEETQAATSAETAELTIDQVLQNAHLLGEIEENGVVALAWLYQRPDSLVDSLPVDISSPYILFVRFLSVDNNVPIERGLVAYKLEDPSGDKSPAEKMDYFDGYFASGLDAYPGHGYLLHIGSKLEDEKKRQYQFALF